MQLAAPLPRGFDLQLVHKLTPPLQASIDALAAAAREVDGVNPFGEHKWLRLVRGDDRCAALLVWDDSGTSLLAAAHCDAYHTSAPNRPCRVTAEMAVHPAHRGTGLGSRMLDAVGLLARDEVADEVHLWAYGNLASAQRLAETFDFAPERALLEYQLPPERLPAHAPRRIFRAFDPGRDADAWLQLHNRVFAGHPEQGAWDTADLDARMQQSWFSADDLLLAEDDQGLLGFCWTKLPRHASQPGEIYIVGVDPRARGTGLGRQLTQAGLAHIRDRGRTGAILFVEAENTPAIRLYEALGFEKRWEHVCYQRGVVFREA